MGGLEDQKLHLLPLFVSSSAKFIPEEADTSSVTTLYFSKWSRRAPDEFLVFFVFFSSSLDSRRPSAGGCRGFIRKSVDVHAIGSALFRTGLAVSAALRRGQKIPPLRLLDDSAGSSSLVSLPVSSSLDPKFAPKLPL